MIIEGNMVVWLGSRNTIYSGLPNRVDWHQRQQRATAAEDLIQGQISDVNEFYLTTNPERAKQSYQTYGVQYIVVGQLEQALYPGQDTEIRIPRRNPME